jgi:hypothetical protein
MLLTAGNVRFTRGEYREFSTGGRLWKVAEWRAFLAWRRAARTEPGDRRTPGRGGALKMYWTKPGPLSAAEGTLLYPNRRVNGTNLEFMGIESIRGSLASMSYGEESMIARTSGRTSLKGPVPLPTQRP